jgi:Peptidase family M23
MAPPPPIKSRFFAYLLAGNQSRLAGFARWIFLPGMLFNSPEQWWGDKKPRAAPHEGLDLCHFENAAGEIVPLDDRIRIPAAFAGQIVKISGDFLGKSIFISHDIFAEGDRLLYTIYGHTEPGPAVRAGQSVAAGEIIGVIADRAGRKTALPPHLHITVAWMPASLPPDLLTWRHIGRDPSIILLDPLLILQA